MLRSNQPIAVFGATGAQGGAVAHTLLAAGYSVRAIARTEAHLQELATKGAEPVAVDLADTEALKQALVGVGGVFVHLPISLLFTPGVLVPTARAIADALTAAAVPLAVYSTSGPVARMPIPEPHYALAAEAEDAIMNADVPVISLRPAGYLENISAPFTAPAVLTGELPYPLPSDFRYRWISHTDQAAFVLAALSRADLAGRHFAIGHAVTGDELATEIATGLGRPLRYRALTPQAFAQTLGAVIGPVAEPIADDYRVIVERADTLGIGDDPQVAEHELGVTLTPIADWVRTQDWEAAAAAFRS